MRQGASSDLRFKYAAYNATGVGHKKYPYKILNDNISVVVMTTQKKL
jgi:hypothetical protein